MKKNVVIAIIIIVFTFLIVFLGCIPKILKDYEIKCERIVKSNCKSMVENILDIKDTKNIKEKSKELVLKYNENSKNPFTRKETAFTTDKKCVGCVSVSFDESTQSINVTGYGKNTDILCRTIIKAPSFVTYEREEK